MKQKALDIDNNRGTVAAYQCLSNAYIGSQRWDEGLKALEEAYRLLPKNGNAVVHVTAHIRNQRNEGQLQATKIPARVGKCTP